MAARYDHLVDIETGSAIMSAKPAPLSTRVWLARHWWKLVILGVVVFGLKWLAGSIVTLFHWAEVLSAWSTAPYWPPTGPCRRELTLAHVPVCCGDIYLPHGHPNPSGAAGGSSTSTQ